MSDKEQTPLPGAGPSLDRLVAAKMGHEWLILKGAFGDDIGRWVLPGTQNSAFDMMWRHESGLDQPQYSTDISAAWEVVEFINNNGHWTKLLMYYSPDNNYQFMIGDKAGVNGWGWSPCDYSEFAETAPLAICLAFLALPDFEVKE